MKAVSQVLVLDFGSQYTQLIARRVREIAVHSLLLPGDASLDQIKAEKPGAIILSGGPRSVTDESALKLPAGFFEYCKREGIAVLGICYGMQVIVSTLNGKVEKGERMGEYGRTEITADTRSKLYKGILL